MQKPKILIYGYGNPGRQDDGLGILLAEYIEEWKNKKGLDYIKTDSNYQLNIEDAAEIAEKDIVIFADASQEDIKDIELTKVKPSPEVNFSMHAVSPAFVLNLCKDIYDKTPQTYLLHIKGYEWELKEELTAQAKKNLNKAYNFLKKIIVSPNKLTQLFQ
ncbi:MAG: hydrogenase maturation protease [Bacteroidales bacterium]|nr:hydrogenase maturation protease [Bacteroidales bacterium]